MFDSIDISPASRCLRLLAGGSRQAETGKPFRLGGGTLPLGQ